MNRKLFGFLMIVTALGGFFASCSDSDDAADSSTARQFKLALTLEPPTDMQDSASVDANAELVNVQTGKTYTTSDFKKSGEVFTDTLDIPEGTYNVSIDGNISYKIDGTTVKTPVKESETNVRLSPASESEIVVKRIALNSFAKQNGFVISELFYTGTLTKEGKQYSYDQYVKIVNNSDSTLYADGLAFVESSFLSTQQQNYTPDIKNQAMTIDAIYVIPGTGKDYPVKPGQELLLALNAQNHKDLNSTSIDLSKADFEFYNESTNPKISDTDNPDVPNLENWYNYSLTIFMLHNRGFKTYALARPQVDMDTFLKDYYYEFSYTRTSNGNTYNVTQHGYKLPNSWVVDAVNLSVEDSYAWDPVSSTLDKGWTYCGEVDHDNSRYGKAVIRKQANGKYVDTNNSTEDFIPDTTPSLFKK